MAVQCVLAGKGKDDVFTAIYGETTFDKVSKAYNEKKVVQVIYQNRIYYLDNTTSGAAFSFISSFSNKNSEIEHYVISLSAEGNWSEPSLQNSTPAIHANTHTKNGTDPLAPADIGAMELSESVLKQSGEDITSQVAQALSKNLVPFSGGTMTGLLNVLTPVGDSNATTKKYVDDALSKKIEMDSIGDLHVWKKTVVTSEPVPARYEKGDIITLADNKFALVNGTGWDSISVASAVSFDADAATLSLASPATFTTWKDTATLSGPGGTLQISSLPGKFVSVNKGSQYQNLPDGLEYDKIYFIPEDATCGYLYSWVITTKILPLIIHPYTPAGTTITYPVSTNRNAYQEGSDAKPAGYVLEGATTKKLVASTAKGSGISFRLYYSDSLTVSDSGEISLSNPSTNVIYMTGASSQIETCQNYIRGKFFYVVNQSDGISSDIANQIQYGASDAVVTWDESGGTYKFSYVCTNVSSVTGYAAIPANTTIEYLGCLGEKTRMQYGTYVGTNTYGNSNPCKLTFDFPPKMVIIMETGSRYASIFMRDSTKYHNNIIGTSGLGVCEFSGNTLTYYSYQGVSQQLNNSNYTYAYIALG